MKIETKNFNPESDKMLNCSCEKCAGKICKITQDTLNKVQKIRDVYGHPLIVTSGYRCKNHPAEAGKSSEGSHQKGVAVDFKCLDGYDAARIIRAAFDADVGLCGFAYGPGFVHLDFDDEKGFRTWRY